MPAITYPAELETYWIQVAQAETHGNTLRDVLHRMRPDISRLADRFTTARTPDAPDQPYLRDTRSCAAYSLFFAPQTHARLSLILAELPPFPETTQPLRVLDLGCGTGAASWALLDHLGPRPVALTATDHSRPAIRCLHDLFSALRRSRWPNATLRTHSDPLEDFSTTGERYDVILLHYVMNELSPSARAALLATAARSLAPHGRLILCEPLIHEAGDYLRDLRTQAVGNLGLHPLAPCPHSLACPLDGPCHDVRTWKITQALQILNSTLHRDLRHLAFSFLVLTPTSPAPSANLRARVVGSPSFAKGQTLCPACCPDGQLHRLQLLNRDFDTDGRKAIRNLERGQVLHLASLQPLADPALFRATPVSAGTL